MPVYPLFHILGNDTDHNYVDRTYFSEAGGDCTFFQCVGPSTLKDFPRVNYDYIMHEYELVSR